MLHASFCNSQRKSPLKSFKSGCIISKTAFRGKYYSNLPAPRNCDYKFLKKLLCLFQSSQKNSATRPYFFSMHIFTYIIPLDAGRCIVTFFTFETLTYLNLFRDNARWLYIWLPPSFWRGARRRTRWLFPPSLSGSRVLFSNLLFWDEKSLSRGFLSFDSF